MTAAIFRPIFRAKNGRYFNKTALKYQPVFSVKFHGNPGRDSVEFNKETGPYFFGFFPSENCMEWRGFFYFKTKKIEDIPQIPVSQTLACVPYNKCTAGRLVMLEMTFHFSKSRSRSPSESTYLVKPAESPKAIISLVEVNQVDSGQQF